MSLEIKGYTTVYGLLRTDSEKTVCLSFGASIVPCPLKGVPSSRQAGVIKPLPPRPPPTPLSPFFV